MKRKLITAVFLASTLALLIGGCGGNKTVDLASGGIKSNSSNSATGSSETGDTTQEASQANNQRPDDAFSNDPQFQNSFFDFKPIVMNGKTEKSISALVGTKIHTFMSLEEIEGNTVEISMDLHTMVESGAITDEFIIKHNDGEITARAINVFGVPVELDQCFICSVKITDKSGTLSLAKDMTCGVRTYDEILKYYTDHNLYLKSDDSLIYKNSDHEIDYGQYTSPSNEVSGAIFANTREVDGIFKFDNGILNSISLEAPELLYYELRRNVSQYELEQMDEDELSNIEKKRNQFLGELKNAFAASAVDVTIDDTTGTISMNSDILFDTDSYEVKDTAKQYIDDFFKVYTSVLLRDDVKSEISVVLFDGHTDTQGDYDYNMSLSLNRAKSVMDYCINDSVLDDSTKSELKSLAEAEGFSYQYPIYTNDGQVDMDASRRVEVNFVIKTAFEVDEPKETASSDSCSTPSATARGYKANPQYKDVDAALYNEDSRMLYPSSPVLLVGDKTELVPGVDNDFDKKTIVFSSSNPEIGEVTYEDSSEFRNFYFTVKSAGTARVEMICPGNTLWPETQFINIRCFEENSEKELSLVPDKDTVVLNDQSKQENVKFTLCGDYSGDVWAFVYYSDAESYGSVDADWIDSTTLSVDISKSMIEEGEHSITIMLTPKDDLDTMLGCLRYKFTVEKD